MLQLHTPSFLWESCDTFDSYQLQRFKMSEFIYVSANSLCRYGIGNQQYQTYYIDNDKNISNIDNISTDIIGSIYVSDTSISNTIFMIHIDTSSYFKTMPSSFPLQHLNQMFIMVASLAYSLTLYYNLVLP